MLVIFEFFIWPSVSKFVCLCKPNTLTEDTITSLSSSLTSNVQLQGVAAVLGLMLRKQYPKLYVLGFSPPGCVFSERMAEESKEFVCSYVLHNDIVPRLSYHSLVNLRNDLVEIIARIKVPKHQVFDSNYKHSNESTLAELPDKLLYGREEIPASDFLSNFDEFKQRQIERQHERDRHNINMTLPGRC